MTTIEDVDRYLKQPKFWLWGELYFTRWYSGGILLMRVTHMPDYCDVLGRVKEHDVWYDDPYGGGY